MMKIYCNVCNKYGKYSKLKNLKLSNIFKKSLGLSIVYSKCRHEDKKIFGEEESIKIKNIIGLILNI